MAYDVIVIGGGVMGCACAWRLAQTGAGVLCLEANSIPNSLGSSHGETRAIRKAYFEHPNYVPLLEDAYRLWADLEEDSERKILYITGGLYAGPPDSPLIAGTRESSRIHSLELLEVERESLPGIAPLTVPDGFDIIFETSAGVLMAEVAVRALYDAALRAGAAFEIGTKVHGWSRANGEFRIETSAGILSGKKVVVCAGAWAAKLLPNSVGANVRITRQVMGWVNPPNPIPFKQGSFPFWAIQEPDEIFYYGFPIMPAHDGLKAACHTPGLVVDPDSDFRIAQSEDNASFLTPLERYFGLSGCPVTQTSRCMYVNSPDSHFLIDQLEGGAFVISGCSGHGFKFAPALGDAVAKWVATGSRPQELGFLSWERF